MYLKIKFILIHKMKISEQDKTYHRELVWNNALNLLIDFDKKKFENTEYILRNQTKFINNINVNGKNKYKSVEILNTYLKSKDKNLAEQVFWNTIKNKIK